MSVEQERQDQPYKQQGNGNGIYEITEGIHSPQTKAVYQRVFNCFLDHKLNTRLVAILMIVVIGSTIISQTALNVSVVYASESLPYDSGRDQGCDDAGISDSNDRYINQPEKGPSLHTEEFMAGYYDGFNNCGGGRDREFEDSTADDGGRGFAPGGIGETSL